MAVATLHAISDWSRPVQPDDVSLHKNENAIEPKYTDEAVLSIVVQDYNSSVEWLNTNQWTLHWRENMILYQSPRTSAVFEGSGNVSRANISRFDVARQVNSLSPAIAAAVFSEPTPFEIRNNPNTHSNTARAWKEFLSILLTLCNFKQTASDGLDGMVNQGTVIFKIGWEEYEEIEVRWVPKEAPEQKTLPMGDTLHIFAGKSDEFERKEEVVVKKRPTFEKCALGKIFPNPKWDKPNRIDLAGWVVYEDYLNYEDLTRLRQNPDYDIPDDDTLRRIFMEDYEQTEGQNVLADALNPGNSLVQQAEREDSDTYENDPLEKPMQILERWSEGKVMATLQQKVVIRNQKNPVRRIPYLSANYWNIEDSGWGMGIGRVAGADQRLNQGLTCAAADILAFATNPEYAILRGANVPTQEQRRRLGGIRLVDGPDASKAIALIQQPQVPTDVWRAIQTSVQASENATGADQAAVQGSLPGQGSSIGRSSRGAGMIQAASQGRLQAPVERFVEGVVLPFMDFLWDTGKETYTIPEIRLMLGDEMTKALAIDWSDFLNSKLKFDNLAGSRLAARARMAQSLPFLLEILGNQALIQQLTQTGWKVNALEVVNMVLQVSEWKNQNDLIVKMNDEEVKALAAQNPALIKAQSDQAKMQQEHQNDMELEDEKISGRIASKAIEKQHGKLIDSPLERAAAFAQRLQDENNIRNSQYYGG